MLKNSKGFSLFECMTALLILSIGIQFMIPIFSKSYFEAQSLSQHQEALRILQNTLITWAKNGQSPPDTKTIQSTVYHLQWSTPASSSAKLCVQWVINSNRTGNECGEIKR